MAGIGVAQFPTRHEMKGPRLLISGNKSPRIPRTILLPWNKCFKFLAFSLMSSLSRPNCVQQSAYNESDLVDNIFMIPTPHKVNLCVHWWIACVINGFFWWCHLGVTIFVSVNKGDDQFAIIPNDVSKVETIRCSDDYSPFTNHDASDQFLPIEIVFFSVFGISPIIFVRAVVNVTRLLSEHATANCII